MNQLKRRLTMNKSGVVLTYVMIVLLVMTIIISGVVFITVGNLNKSTQTSDHMEAYYVAEGGINYLTQVVTEKYNYNKTNNPSPMSTFFTNMDSIVALYPVSNKLTIPFSDNGGKTSYAQVWISVITSETGTIHKYQLNSEGYIGSVHRLLTKQIEVNYASGGTAFNNAFMAISGTTFIGVQIHGPVQTTLKTDGAIIFGKNSSAYKVYIPSDAVLETVVKLDGNTWTQAINDTKGITGKAGIYKVEVPTVKQVPVKATPSILGVPKLNAQSYGSCVFIDSNRSMSIPNNTTISNLANVTYNLTTANPANLGSTFYVPTIKILGDAPTFKIQLDRDITLITDTLWLDNRFTITGPGKLTIYVRRSTTNSKTNLDLNAFRMNSSNDIGNPTTPTNFIIYIAEQLYNSSSEAVTVTFSSQNVPPTFYLSLIAANLNYNLNTVIVNGALATNGTSVIFDSHANGKAMLIYAPNATITGKSSAANLYGAVIGKTYINGAGGSQPTITYAPEVNDYVPADTLDLTGLVGAPTINLTKSATQE